MKNNYTILHLHSMFSNGSMMDSVTSYKQYIDKAKELNMKSIAFTEHGNIFGWYNKYKYCKENDIKYIHGCEVYLTETLDEKLRDNYHCVLLAKNNDGLKELNLLISQSYNRKNGHYYYRPRISIPELISTTDNIIVMTACLGSVLNNGNDKVKDTFIEFLSNNKYRCFLEVAHHKSPEQCQYNKYLLELSNSIGVNIVIGTDTHCLNEEHAECRKVMQKAKDIYFADEELYDMCFRNYTEIYNALYSQGVFSEEQIVAILDNSNIISDMVEEYTIDTSYKYPNLYENSEKIFNEKIEEGIKWRYPNIDEEFDKILRDRIEYEKKAIYHNGAIDYFLLEYTYKKAMRDKNIYCGPSRGSSSGSIICYLLGITEVDSIKWNLNYDRFMHIERVSLCDIDSDWYKDDIPIVKEYLFNMPKVQCCDIITYNTIQLKGAFKDVARAFGIDITTANSISKTLDGNDEKIRKKYPEIFKIVDIVIGTIVSVGSHPAAVVVSTENIQEFFGTFTKSDSDRLVSQIDMGEIDSLNYTKIDVLGLNTQGLITSACKLADINRLTPNNMDFEDEKVWLSIRDDNTGIFQIEEHNTGRYIAKLFSDNVIAINKQKNPDFKYLELFSIGSSAIRPAGDTYRDLLSDGVFFDNGFEPLNQMLASTQGFCVYQEQIMEFLNKFCGYTMGQADIVRRGLAKKKGTEHLIPDIQKGFIENVTNKYGLTVGNAEKVVEPILDVIISSSSYAFSILHSKIYAMMGYMCGWLRYYYPLEFIVTALNIWGDDEEKTASIVSYAQRHNITLSKAKFGYSTAEYYIDKENNTIYKGMKSIKYVNSTVPQQLLQLSKNREYDNFLDLLIDITKFTDINSRMLEILIKLDFFVDFGNSKYLLECYKIFTECKEGNMKTKDKSKVLDDQIMIYQKFSTETAKQYKIIDCYGLIKSLFYKAKLTHLCDFSYTEKAKFQLEYLGYLSFATHNKADIYKLFITEIRPIKTKDKSKVWAYELKTYNMCTGRNAEITIYSRIFNKKEIAVNNVILIDPDGFEVKEYNGFKNCYVSKYDIVG